MRTTPWRTITASGVGRLPFETTDEGKAPECFERAARRGRRGAHLNDRGDTRPTRVSRGQRGGRGRRLAGADPDRSVAAAVGAVVLRPVRAAARLPREYRGYLACGRVRDRVLDVEIDLTGWRGRKSGGTKRMMVTFQAVFCSLLLAGCTAKTGPATGPTADTGDSANPSAVHNVTLRVDGMIERQNIT